MKTEKELRLIIGQLLKSQQLAVLATEFNHRPYASLMAFAYAENLKKIYFFTERATQKYNNVSRNGNISMLIDNRTNTIDDFKKAMAVTIKGQAKELSGAEKTEVEKLLLNRYPYLADYIHSSLATIFQFSIEEYVFVDEFQHTAALKP